MPRGVQASKRLAAAVAAGALPSLLGGAGASSAVGRDPYASDSDADAVLDYSDSSMNCNSNSKSARSNIANSQNKSGEKKDRILAQLPGVHGSNIAAASPSVSASAAATAAAVAYSAAALTADAAAGVNWFPGHMAAAVQAMSEKLKDVELVIEVRDARCALSSANPLLDRVAAGKPRVVVLNKADLALGPTGGAAAGNSATAAARAAARAGTGLLDAVARELLRAHGQLPTVNGSQS